VKGNPFWAAGLQATAVGHGCYRPECGLRVRRIRYASDDTNYCTQCQTGRRLLADRAFSRLLHDDWPRTLEELEALTKS
jgi:formamidopyrimidine-DNA glycosylase